MTAIVTRGDAASLHLPDETVDLIVTSPPYWSLRSYQDDGQHYSGQLGDEATPGEYIDNLIACTREWMRVLKPGGSLFLNMGDKYSTGSSGDRNNGFNERSGNSPGKRAQERSQTKSAAVVGMAPKSLIGLPWRYAIRCIDELGLILRAEIVWAKPNGLPESVTDRVRRSHEQVFHFVKQPRYFSAVDDVREPQATVVTASGAVRYRKPGEEIAPNRQTIKDDKYLTAGMRGGYNGAPANPLGKLPGSVWEIPTAPLKVPASLGIDHFAAYPPELVRRIVLGWSPDGGTVLDPFGGTGTTALVASCFGRVGISVDLSADYCRLARWRTTDPGERARVLGVEKPPVQVDGQLGMFEGIGA